MTAKAANRWCGGQIRLLCAAIGEKDTIGQTYKQKVPSERRLFLRRLFSALGGKVGKKIDYRADDDETQRAKTESADRLRGISVLGMRSAPKPSGVAVHSVRELDSSTRLRLLILNSE